MMTPERRNQLRVLAAFATYVVPAGRRMPMSLDAHAGNDILELCDALATAEALAERLAAVLATIPEDVIAVHAGLEQEF